MKRVKIAQGYNQSGYGRGFKKSPIVYLINGKLYAKDKAGSETDFHQLAGELEGYIRVNKLHKLTDSGSDYYYQVSGHSKADEHKEYIIKNTDA